MNSKVEVIRIKDPDYTIGKNIGFTNGNGSIEIYIKPVMGINHKWSYPIINVNYDEVKFISGRPTFVVVLIPLNSSGTKDLTFKVRGVKYMGDNLILKSFWIGFKNVDRHPDNDIFTCISVEEALKVWNNHCDAYGRKKALNKHRPIGTYARKINLSSDEGQDYGDEFEPAPNGPY